MESIIFAEWLAENHFKMHNKKNGICFWINENSEYTTKELYKLFKKETNY